MWDYLIKAMRLQVGQVVVGETESWAMVWNIVCMLGSFLDNIKEEISAACKSEQKVLKRDVAGWVKSFWGAPEWPPMLPVSQSPGGWGVGGGRHGAA
jgi:hypothetical protein